MGYYTGNGVTSSGNSSVGILESFIFYGAHNVYQRDTSRTNTKSGVSLSTAQSVSGDCSMNPYQFEWSLQPSGSAWHWTPNLYGTKTDVNFTRIGDSNLYVLSVTSHTISGKIDNGGWVGA